MGLVHKVRAYYANPRSLLIGQGFGAMIIMRGVRRIVCQYVCLCAGPEREIMQKMYEGIRLILVQTKNTHEDTCLELYTR